VLAFVTRVLEYFGDPNWVIADFTVVLAFSTIGLWIVTWRSGVRQSRDMEGAIAAALAANEISQKNMITDQRAWVTVGDLKIESNQIIFRKHGADIQVSVKIENIGKSPALAIHTSMEMIFDYADAPDAVKKLSETAKTIDVAHWTRTLLPGESYRRKWGFQIAAPDTGRKISFPVIVGCTTYKISPDNTTHQTGFVFHLFECEPGKPTEYVDFLKSGNTPLPKDQIGWDGGAGGFAD